MTSTRTPNAGLIPGGQHETPVLASAGSHRSDGDDMQVFPTTYALEVFVNQSDEITIRQEGQYGDDHSVISIPPQYVGALIAALRKTKRELLSDSGES